MDRETIISYVKENTRIKTSRVTTLCQMFIDSVQDNHITKNIFEHEFSWLKAYGYLSTIPLYSTGTVTVVQDSATVQGTSTAWTTATMADRLVKFNTDTNYYEVLSIVDGTQVMTLKTAYIGDDDTDGVYAMYKVNYDLASDFGNMRWIKQTDTMLTVKYAMAGINATTKCQMIRLSPVQTARAIFYYCYDKHLVTANSTGVSSSVPSGWHMLFVHKLSELIFDAHDMNGKARLEDAKFKELLKTFVNDDLALQRDNPHVMSDEAVFKKGIDPGYYNLPTNFIPEI